MNESFPRYCLRFQSLRLSPPKAQGSNPQHLILISSHLPNPNSISQQLLLLRSISRRICSTSHLRQLLCRATSSGLKFCNHNLHLLNSIIHSLSGCPSPSLALTFFKLLHSQPLSLDDYTFTSALKAASRLSHSRAASQLHSLLIKLCLEYDTFVLNSLIHTYSTCGLIAIARKVFDLGPESSRDVVTWNSMASGYSFNHLYEESLILFAQMVERSNVMDADTLAGALTACAKTGASKLGRKIHSLAVTRGLDMDSCLGSSLISMYSKCGAVDFAWKLFDRMPERNVTCWTAMVSGYAQSNMFGKAIELFRRMQAERVKPDEHSVSSVLSSCAQLGALDQGKYIHAYCDVAGVRLGLSAKNALIDMYSKCGEIDRALSIFHELESPDVFSWTIMLSGLAMNGKSFQALELFSRMEASSSIVPNEVTFLGVLLACSHGGLIEQGYFYFDRMRRVYNLLPRLEHYGCMVDLLGRARLLSEAEKFVRDMPIEPDVVIWRSLLFACRINGDVSMAEFAAQRIMELEPEMCGGPVMLSNVYAAASRWTEVNRMRRSMYFQSIYKQPGCSFIELHGVLHEFLSAAKSHPQFEIMCEVLDGISSACTDQMTDAWTRPGTSMPAPTRGWTPRRSQAVNHLEDEITKEAEAEAEAVVQASIGEEVISVAVEGGAGHEEVDGGVPAAKILMELVECGGREGSRRSSGEEGPGSINTEPFVTANFTNMFASMAQILMLLFFLIQCAALSSSSSPPTPAPWPEQFHSILIMNYRGALSLIDLWYDWPNGRNFNIIQEQLGGPPLYDLEWNNGTSFFYRLPDSSSPSCRSIQFPVGILRPNWLEGATYLGRSAVDGFLCDGWEKIDFIRYYEDVATRRPVYWAFYTGRQAHVMTFEVGAALDDDKWQAPAYCFEENGSVETSLEEEGLLHAS